MYFAGRLESKNTEEYKDAARFAKDLGLSECVTDMLHMSDTELEHEKYFLSVIVDRWILRPVTLFYNGVRHHFMVHS